MNNNINSAIRDLQNAVYYIDTRGRYASLPDNNSMRIDLLSARLEQINEKIDQSGGVSVEDVNKMVNYLDGSATISEFNPPAGDIIQVEDTDPHKGEYTNVKDTLQLIYSKQSNDSRTGIVVDSMDPFIAAVVASDFPRPPDLTEEKYRDDMSKYPNTFPYLYTQMRFTYDKLFERETDFNVFTNMIPE